MSGCIAVQNKVLVVVVNRSWWFSKPSEEFEVMGYGLVHIAVFPVVNPEFSGGFPHNFGQCGVVGMCNLWKNMVNHMVIQTATNEIGNSATGRIIGGGSKDVIHKIMVMTGFWKLIDVQQVCNLNDPGCCQSH